MPRIVRVNMTITNTQCFTHIVKLAHHSGHVRDNLITDEGGAVWRGEWQVCVIHTVRRGAEADTKNMHKNSGQDWREIVTFSATCTHV